MGGMGWEGGPGWAVSLQPPHSQGILSLSFSNSTIWGLKKEQVWCLPPFLGRFSSHKFFPQKIFFFLIPDKILFFFHQMFSLSDMDGLLQEHVSLLRILFRVLSLLSLSVPLTQAALFRKVVSQCVSHTSHIVLCPGQSDHLSWKYIIHSTIMEDLGGNQRRDSKIYTLIHCMKTCKSHSKY